jgi:hypothetical protein
MFQTAKNFTSYPIDIKGVCEDKNNNLNFKSYTSPAGVEYEVVNYENNKDFESFNEMDNDGFRGAYRSIVLEPETQEVLSFAPPKSVPLEVFKEKFPDFQKKNLFVNEIIEGTMINLFYDKRAENWEISTKGAVGGDYWYFRNTYENAECHQSTFREMFLNACRVNSDGDIKDIPFMNDLCTDYCYSFVLQHPENHIVLPITTPIIYLVAVYCVRNNDQIHKVCGLKYEKNEIVSLPLEYFVDLQTYGIMLPRLLYSNGIVNETYESLYRKYCNIHGFQTVGLMITDMENGYRTKMVNDNYETLKKIRGNNPNLHYQYLSLLKADQVMTFLSLFPRYTRIFNQFYYQQSNFIKKVHDAYVMYFIKKQGKNVVIDKSIFRHIHNIHKNIYLENMAKGTKVIITRQVITDWFNRFEPKEMLYHLNYLNRDYAEQCEKNGINLSV